jgi:hypothetical protein
VTGGINPSPVKQAFWDVDMDNIDFVMEKVIDRVSLENHIARRAFMVMMRP